ncbi:ABC transporter ATP-binding protein [Asticcacaulis endophyticus]|jgi:lipopolysaccharide transport system ATP-binding protein|uniref:ABC transporter ATP-binding protein n=1 Tax=Asticcacaulis endophyticus TaxID=1395890 RepID=A0A918UQ38_9CAUL|nr:ATP-binding cassette domain-containing protein [Asticcacaulis endophyticus]GGZ25695.1 ABC transporter ATP-binding protein [Asticcacaulis endophyticus]
MASIDVNGLTIDYPVYGVSARNIRSTVANLFLGGTILKNKSDTIFVESLANVSFSLKSGDRLGVIGENGAGKTTLLRAISGFLPPSRGSVTTKGSLASLINVGAGLDPDRTGRENAVIMSLILGARKKDLDAIIVDIIAFAELGAFFDMPVRAYSAGMILRLSFAVSTVIDPNILVLDEGILAGDQHFIGKARDRMDRIYRNTDIIVLSSHSMELIDSVCNKVLLLNRGKVAFLGDVKTGIQLYNDRSYISGHAA